jgi:hypothetical protein
MRKKIMFHGSEPTVIPCFGTISPGVVDLPEALANQLLAAGEKTGDYSPIDAPPRPRPEDFGPPQELPEQPVTEESQAKAPRSRQKE